MKTKVIITLLSLMSLISFAAVAQENENQNAAPQNRGRWISEIRKYKQEFIAQELALSEEQQAEFFRLYEEMEGELEEVNAKVCKIEKDIENNEEAEDAEIENAARAIFEQKRIEGQIEMTYFEKFKEVLSPRQLLNLKDAERDFMKKLMNVKRKHRNNRNRE